MLSAGNYIKNKLSKNKGFILFMLIFIAVRWSFADHYRVPTGSMKPTIQIGDHVFVNKMAYDLKIPFTDIVLAQTDEPQRGEIIVFKYPLDPSINFVKRLIAVPGDRVEVVDGFIVINGKSTLEVPEKLGATVKQLSESAKEFSYSEKIGEKIFTVKRQPTYSREQQISFTVPKGQYFFMGDNRDNSGDSRIWGFVPRENLKGRVKAVTISVAFDGIVPKINVFRFGKKLI